MHRRPLHDHAWVATFCSAFSGENCWPHTWHLRGMYSVSPFPRLQENLPPCRTTNISAVTSISEVVILYSLQMRIASTMLPYLAKLVELSKKQMCFMRFNPQSYNLLWRISMAGGPVISTKYYCSLFFRSSDQQFATQYRVLANNTATHGHVGWPKKAT